MRKIGPDTHLTASLRCADVADNDVFVHFLAALLSTDETLAPSEQIDAFFHEFLDSEPCVVLEQEFGRVFLHDPALRGPGLATAFDRTLAIFDSLGWPTVSEAAMCGAGSEAAMCGAGSEAAMCGAGSEAAMCGAGSEAAMCGAGSEAAMCGGGSEAAMCGAGSAGLSPRPSDVQGIAARIVRVLQQAA